MIEHSCELSVVIPAYQEGSHLYSSVTRIRECVRGVTPDYEIIVVDDGSTDTTWTEIARLSAEFPDIRGLRLSRRFGKDAALSAGLANCTGKGVLTLDADLQHPPSTIAEFYRCWKDEGFDIVEGVKSDRDKEPIFRRIPSATFNWLSKRYTGLELTNSTDFKLLDRKVLASWLEMREKRVFFRGLVSWMGFRRKQIPFEVDRRADGSSKWSTLLLIRLAVSATIAFSSAPLRIAHVVAILFLLFAALLGSEALYLKFTGAAVSGFTTVIIVLLLTGGLILIVLGVIAEYLAAIYEELKGRPRYFVAESSPAGSKAGADRDECDFSLRANGDR